MTQAEQILKAAEEGDAFAVHQLLTADSALANVKGGYDKTPLHWAAEKNYKQVAEAFVAAGANIHAETTWGMTPLAWAANMGSRDVAEVLIARGAELNMWCAAGLGMLEVVESYWETPATLKKGAGQPRPWQDEKGNWWKSPPHEEYAALVSDAFYIAARNGHLRVARFLLEKGADVNFKGFFGGTGLHWAAINGHKEMVEFLVNHGADLGQRDDEFHSPPLNWALEGKHHDIAELLRRRAPGD